MKLVTYCEYIRVATFQILLTKKSIFFLHFDMISKCPLPDISTKLLLMSPFYASKVEIFQCWLYLSSGTKCAGIV